MLTFIGRGVFFGLNNNFNASSFPSLLTIIELRKTDDYTGVCMAGVMLLRVSSVVS